MKTRVYDQNYSQYTDVSTGKSSSQTCNDCLLKLQFIFLTIITISFSTGFYLLHREFTLQRQFYDDQLGNLSQQVDILNRDVRSFAKNDFVEFVTSEIMDDDEDGITSEEASGDLKTKNIRSAVNGGSARRYRPPPKGHRGPANYRSADLLRRTHRKRIVPSANFYKPDATSTARTTEVRYNPQSNIVQSDTEYVWLTSHSRIPVSQQVDQKLSITPCHEVKIHDLNDIGSGLCKGKSYPENSIFYGNSKKVPSTTWILC